MKNFLFPQTICIILTVFVSLQIGYATDNVNKLKKQYELALKYKHSTQRDSAVIIFKQIIEALSKKRAIDSEMGLSVRLHLSEIKVELGEDVSSVTRGLHQIIEGASIEENWKIVAEAKIILGLIHQKNRQYEDCKKYLNEAILLIKRYQLQELYARYAVRRSTYLRRSSVQIDSIEYYANEAIAHATTKETKTKAEAYFNLARVARFSSNEAAIEYYKKAAALYRELGDDVQEVAAIVHIAEVHNAMNQLDSANWYNDLAKKDFNKVTLPILFNIYHNKAQIYRQFENIDSSWHFLKLAYEARLEKIIQENRKAITEAEERYQSQKKSTQIEQQQEALKSEKVRRNRTTVIAFVLLVLIVLLAYFYLQLRKVNQINRLQAKQLKNLDQAKSRFFANISHELRTPLTLMTGPIHTLIKENQLTDKQATLLQTAADSGHQLKQLINEILDLRKLELDKMVVDIQPTPLHAFFLRYVTQFDSLAVRKEINFTHNLEIDQAIVAELDQEKSRQILYNLLSNAFKFTPKGESITVSVSFIHQQLFITLSDTGRGVHPEDLPYIFDRYFQTNRPDRPIEGGTGIGLALCKEYVKLLGGNIEVESKLGKGTVFKLSFPLTLVTENQAIIATSGIQSSTKLNNTTRANESRKTDTIHLKKKARILVVEDNIALSNYLKLLLSEQYEVTTAEDGQQAWDILFSNKKDHVIHNYQLILSDLMMPVMDGYQLLEKLKSHDSTRHIPVIMLTARAELQDRMKALRIGVDDYLTKPFEEEELLVRIENLLRHQVVRNLQIAATREKDHTIPIISEEDQKWLSELEQFVQRNLSNNALSVPMLADQFLISEPTLFRQMKRIIGLSPAQYLKEVRLKKALRLLENNIYNSVAKVAYEVGYSDPNSFTRAFKHRFGKSPSKIVNH